MSENLTSLTKRVAELEAEVAKLRQRMEHVVMMPHPAPQVEPQPQGEQP